MNQYGLDALTSCIGKTVAKVGHDDDEGWWAAVWFADGSRLRIDGWNFDVEYNPPFITDRDPGDETEEPGYGPGV